MRKTHGRGFSVDEIEKIKRLLRSTELTLQEIAIRMDCAKSSIVAVNQSCRIREYRGRRRYWTSPELEGLRQAE